MIKGENLTEFVNKIQVLCDDASMDFAYVHCDFAVNEEGGLGAVFDKNEIIAEAKLDMLGFAAEKLVKLNRANGAMGRGTVSAKWTDNGLEVNYKFIKSTDEMFKYLRAVA